MRDIGPAKTGAKGESNPRPLAPKARIIPLHHWPFGEARGIRTPNLRVWNPTRCHCAIASRTVDATAWNTVIPGPQDRQKQEHPMWDSNPQPPD